jgi:lipopolysaccharide transport system permease protein
MFSNVATYREFIFQLFLRDFLGGFRKSLLGIGWLFISPLVGIFSWVFMNKAGILNPGDVGIPYPAYILFGTSCWSLFMGFYTATAGTLVAGGNIILQVKYPHEVLLFKQAAQFLAGYVIGFVANILVLIAFEVMPHWPILIFPILAVPIFLLGSAIGLLVSILNVVSNDIGKLVDLILGWSLYLTPIIYSSKIDNAFLQEVINWNPLTYLIGGVRDLVLFGTLESPSGYLYSSLFALVAFLISWRLFFVSEGRVVEKIM